MTEPTPTPEKQNLSATPSSEGQENSSTPERDGFFKRVRRGIKPHPTEAEEIVVDMTPIERTDAES